MSNYPLPADLVAEITELKRRLAALEKANPLNNGTIDEGGLIVKDGSITFSAPGGVNFVDELNALVASMESPSDGNMNIASNFSMQIASAFLLVLYATAGDVIVNASENVSIMADTGSVHASAEDIFLDSRDAMQLWAEGPMTIICDTDMAFFSDTNVEFDCNRIGWEPINAIHSDFLNANTGSTASSKQVWINAIGNLHVPTSSEKFKTDIEPLEVDLDALMKIVPMIFRNKAEMEEWKDIHPDFGIPEPAYEVGMIAERLDEAGLNVFVQYDDNNEPVGIHYERFVTALLLGYQDQERRLRNLEGKVK